MTQKRWNVVQVEQTVADLERILNAINHRREAVMAELEHARRELAELEQKPEIPPTS
jgi:hypothetical protein